MNHNYTVQIIISILSMIFLAIDVGKNTILSHRDIKWFRITFILAAIGAFCEYMGVLFDHMDNSPVALHHFITFVEFCLSPYLGVCLAYSSTVKLNIKPVFCVISLNVVVQVISLFNEMIFRIDETGVFVRGSAYWMYLVFCGIGFVFILYVFIRMAVKSHARNILCIVIIALIVIIGQAANTIDGNINSGYFSICITATLLYIFIQNMIRHQMVETINKEKNISNHDALTKVMSRISFDNVICELDEKIKETPQNVKFAVCECDLNNLKQINDSFGHDAGDEYIIGCCKVICDFFKHSPVFRIGGDEFVAILQSDDYDNLESIKKEVLAFSEQEIKRSGSLNQRKSFAAGFGVFNAQTDHSFSDAMKRADTEMYETKKQLKRLINP